MISLATYHSFPLTKWPLFDVYSVKGAIGETEARQTDHAEYPRL